MVGRKLKVAEFCSKSAIVLTWAAPSDSVVTGYQILRRLPRQNQNRQATDNTGASTLTTINPAFTLNGISPSVTIRAMTNKREEFQNRKLALLLADQGLDTDFEQRAGRRQMDVVAQVEGLRVVLEAETGFHRKAQAIKDADARLRQKLTTAVFAVCYPVGVTEDNLAESTLTWTLRVTPGAPEGEWSTGSIPQLAQAVQQVPRSLSGADVAAKLLSDGLDEAVQRLSTPVRQALAQALDLPPTKQKKSTSQTDAYAVAAKRGMLVVATAMLFHHRVQNYLPPEAPEGFDGTWPPATAVSCSEQDATITAFREAWRGILAVDYRPVFETGRVALSALSADPDTGQAVQSLAEVVSQVAERVTGLRHDLLGRIFHRVLDTARYDGSYYTSTAAAVLLATLAIQDQDTDWSDANVVAAMRICDPACGTGTLLMAAAERIRDLRNARGVTDPEDDEALGLMLVEDVLWGYDVNLSATHMAASTLGMLSPTTRFNRMNIHRTLLGVYRGSPYLGSLDFLAGQARLAGWPSATQQVESEQGTATPPPDMDLVIMNPPFTRDSLRHDQFSRAGELAIKRREKEVMEGLTDRAAARLSGSANSFMVLGERFVDRQHGTLAVVLPTVMATNPAAFHTRLYLAQRFHIDTIVSIHDPKRIFFSENTSIGEVLIICRRWNRSDPKPPTRVVNLAKNPTTPMEALDTASRINQPEDAEEPAAAQDFTVQQVSADRIARGDWFAVNFLSPFLVDAYRTLTETDPASIPMVPLSSLANVGPEGRRIRDSYTRSDLPTTSGRRALWHHKTDISQSMAGKADSYIEPKPAKRHLADRYWEQRSQMLLPHRLWLPLARVASVMLPEPVVGSIWTPCRPHDSRVGRALCLYLNSSLGLLALLGGRDNRKPSYPSFSLDTLRSLSVPDLTHLSDAKLHQLNDAFDQLQSDVLQPLPQIANDPVRAQIDAAVNAVLGIDTEWLSNVRRELAKEPSVTDSAYS